MCSRTSSAGSCISSLSVREYTGCESRITAAGKSQKATVKSLHNLKYTVDRSFEWGRMKSKRNTKRWGDEPA
jgi:hypothetical protein